jgi:hypothetical protein
MCLSSLSLPVTLNLVAFWPCYYSTLFLSKLFAFCTVVPGRPVVQRSAQGPFLLSDCRLQFFPLLLSMSSLFFIASHLPLDAYYVSFINIQSEHTKHMRDLCQPGGAAFFQDCRASVR